MTSFSTNIKSMLTRRLVFIVGLMMLGTLATSACAVQESNTYPVETFSEMHYSQSFRAQEPPRLAPPADSVAFRTAGDSSQTYNVPDKQERAYDPVVAGELYRVNCSVCHGISGLGDGKATRHITSGSSFYATTQGSPYGAPPNLVESAASRLTERDTMVAFVTSGAVVMPSFGKLLAEEDIRDIVNYIFDDTTGLSQ
ncbi:MAG: cytochrome c [Chloroflexi bacterium]|jgi:mono/diheme cytochrome c family protein|nr:cytochrome c [Chloroflexota bacterium]